MAKLNMRETAEIQGRADLIARRIFNILQSVRAELLTRRVQPDEKGFEDEVVVQMACSQILGNIVFTAATMENRRSDKTDIIYDLSADSDDGLNPRALPHAVNIIREDRSQMKTIFGFEESLNLIDGRMANGTRARPMMESLARIDKLVGLTDMECSRIVKKYGTG